MRGALLASQFFAARVRSPGAALSARSFGPCARPGSRLARASVATGRPTAVLAVVSARHAPVCCCLVIHAPWRAHPKTGNLASVSITGACARQISWGIGVLQPPRCPWPHQRHASRRGRPRHAAIFCPRTRARARRRPLSSRVIDFGDRDGGVSPEDASGAAGCGWHGAAAARGCRQDAAPERHFGFSGRLGGRGAPPAGFSVMGWGGGYNLSVNWPLVVFLVLMINKRHCAVRGGERGMKNNRS